MSKPLLLLWLAAVVVLAVGWERVRAVGGYGPAETVALATLLGALVVPWLLWLGGVRSGEGNGASRAGPTARALASLLRRPLPLMGLLVLGGFALTALWAPFLAPADPGVLGSLATERYLPPSWSHLLGTDGLGRDVLTRLLYGARISLTVGVMAVLVSVVVGTLLGAVAGFLGGFTDTAAMRFVDMVLAFPRLVLLIAIVALLEPSVTVIIVVLGLTQWPATARIVRGEVLSLREREFITAARALGFSRRRIVLRHLVPNVLGPVLVTATLGIGHTIVLEAGLSFLGVGVPLGTPSWGSMLAEGRSVMIDAWWLSTFPGLAIVLTVLAFNLVGEGLGDAFRPRTRRGRS